MNINTFGRAALSRRFIATAFSVFLAVSAFPAFAAKDASAKAFLESIYQRYVGGSDVAGKGIPLAGAKVVRSYFTVGLASLILEDRATAVRRSEPPVLDGDPFIGHQEWDISNLSIEVKEIGAVKATGVVSFTNAGKPEKIVLELLRSGNDWRIADIQWDSGSLRGLYRKKAASEAAASEAAALPH
jgi:hypothetical protein